MTIVKPSGSLSTTSVNEQLPDFMRDAQVEGTELLKQYVVPPRVKIIQRNARKPFSEMFKPGEIVAVPMMQRIAEYDGGRSPSFHFVPLLFYPEWVAWNPMETRGTLPSVRARTLDPRDPIAVKSRSTETRLEPCPEMPKKDGKDLYVKYLEHLNFIVMMLPPNPLAGLPIVLTFASGEHRSGTNFTTLVQLRRAPLYGCQFEAHVRERDNGKGAWYGIDVQNPSPDTGVTPFIVEKERFEEMRALHHEFKSIHEKKLLQVEYDDEPVEAPPADSKEF